MTYWKRTGSILAAAIVLTSGLLLLEARDAEAHGGRAVAGRCSSAVSTVPTSVSASDLGVPSGPGVAVDTGPGVAPGPATPEGVDTMTVAKMTGWGALELNVKPNRADVWVDGKYVGEARDLDGYPSYLWLEKGPHRLAIYKGGYRTFEEDVDVERGVLKDLKVRLEPGNSPPPGPKPSDKKEQDEKGR